MIDQINIVGPVTDKTGYGIHLTELAKALSNQVDVSITARSHVDPSLVNDPHINKLVHTDFRYDCPTIYIWFADCMQLFTGSPRVAFPVFEADTLSEKECYHIEQQDILLLTSEWAANVVRKSMKEHGKAVPPIYVVGEGFNPAIFQPRVIEDNYLTLGWKRPYVQNIGKWETRKGHPELIKVLGKLADEDLRFTFIAHWGNIFQHDWQTQVNYHLGAAGFYQVQTGNYEKNDVKVVLSSRLESHEDLANLMSICDFGVYPYKGEGWCLPLLETMACGRPVIATNYSGPTEYLRSDVGILIEPIGFQNIYDPTFFNSGRAGNWCQFSEDQLETAMRSMITMSDEERKRLGCNAVERASDFTWDASASKILEALNE